MFNLYAQEMFKLRKKKSTLIWSFIIIVLPFIVAFLGKVTPHNFPPRYIFFNNFTAVEWGGFILIAATASIIASEFQYGTMKELVYQRSSRTIILISKWLAIFTYSLALYLFSSVTSLFAKILFVNGEVSLFKQTGPQIGWQFWLASLFSSFITLWLLLSFVFLIASLFKNGSIAIIIGIIGYFAVNIVGSLLFSLISKYPWLKWNPFNFLFYANQVKSEFYDPGVVEKMTKLTNNEMLLGSLLYIAIFLGVGLLSFRRKEV